MAKGATADVGRALEESLGVIDLKTMRARYVANMRAYMDELITDKRCILGTREGNVQWTKLEAGKDGEMMTTRVHKETKKVRQVVHPNRCSAASRQFVRSLSSHLPTNRSWTR